MTKLLQFLIKHLAFLYNEYQASFTSDGIDKGRASYCGNVKLKIKHLIVEISLDRDELDVDFGTELHYDKDKSNYEEYYDDKFDHQVVWQLITGKIHKSGIFNKKDAVFLHKNMDKILRLFEENNYTQTKQKLEELENERSKRIWGD